MRFLWRRDSLLLGSGPGFLRQKAHSFRDLSVREWLQQLSLVVAEHGWINPLAGLDEEVDQRMNGGRFKYRQQLLWNSLRRPREIDRALDDSEVDVGCRTEGSPDGPDTSRRLSSPVLRGDATAEVGSSR